MKKTKTAKTTNTKRVAHAHVDRDKACTDIINSLIFAILSLTFPICILYMYGYT